MFNGYKLSKFRYLINEKNKFCQGPNTNMNDNCKNNIIIIKVHFKKIHR